MPSRLEAIIGVLDEIVIAVILIVAILWGLTTIGLLSLSSAIIVGTVAGLVLAFFAFVILRPQLRKPLLGPEASIGKKGRALTELRPEGTVLIDGEYWSAVSLEPVSEGEEVGVVAVKGLKLTVKRLTQEDHTL